MTIKWNQKKKKKKANNHLKWKRYRDKSEVSATKIDEKIKGKFYRRKHQCMTYWLNELALYTFCNMQLQRVALALLFTHCYLKYSVNKFRIKIISTIIMELK